MMFYENILSLALIAILSFPLPICPMNYDQALIGDVDSQEEVAGEKPCISNSDIQPDPHARPQYAYDKYEEIEEYQPKSSKVVFNPTTANVFEDAYNRAPADAKNIVGHLKNPLLLNKPRYRSAFLIGSPGVGKTTLAKAIAYKLLPDWEAIFIICAALRGENRGKASMNLLSELKYATADGKKRLVIIDEINRLLENHESKNYDTGENADTLWNFLDLQEEQGNHNFFLLGTMNQADKIPEQIKSRISARCIVLRQLTRFEAKKRSFLNNLIDSSTQLHAECDDNYLKNILRKCKNWSARDYAELSIKIINEFINAGGTGLVKIITKQHIEAGIKAILKTRTKVLKIGTQPETEEQRQNRFHNENMERSEDQFRRQQLIQVTVNENQQSIYRPSVSISPVPAINVTPVRQELTPKGREKVLKILDKGRSAQTADNRHDPAKTAQNQPATTPPQTDEGNYVQIPLVPLIGILLAPQIVIPYLIFNSFFGGQ